VDRRSVGGLRPLALSPYIVSRSQSDPEPASLPGGEHARALLADRERLLGRVLALLDVRLRGARPPKRTVSWTFTILNTLLLYVGFVLVLLGRVDAPLSRGGFASYAPILSARSYPSRAWRSPSGRDGNLVPTGVGRFGSSRDNVSCGRTYSVVRNPIYSGMALAVLGSALVAGTLRGLRRLCPCAFALWQKGRVEERFLLAEFGEEYAAYQREVKFMIPFIG